MQATPTPGLTCNFTLQFDTGNLGVAFQSDNGGMNYGGAVSIQTPATAGPVVTSLWDSDGNVIFTVYLSEKGLSGPTCSINSGANPITYEPDVQVWSQNGLQCEITQNGGGGGVYSYSLAITAGSDNDFEARKAPKTRANTLG